MNVRWVRRLAFGQGAREKHAELAFLSFRSEPETARHNSVHNQHPPRSEHEENSSPLVYHVILLLSVKRTHAIHRLRG